MYKGRVRHSIHRKTIFHDIHERLAVDSKANAMTSHRGKDSAYQKISNRFFWHNMLSDVADYVRRCELQSVSAPTEVMKQITVDICNLLEVNGYKH